MLRRQATRVLMTRSSGTAVTDLEIDGAHEKKTKVTLAWAVNEICRELSLTQHEAGLVLNITQPKVSALANYRLSGFSVERLMTFLNALGRDIEIVIRAPRARRAPRIRVTGA